MVTPSRGLNRSSVVGGGGGCFAFVVDCCMFHCAQGLRVIVSFSVHLTHFSPPSLSLSPPSSSLSPLSRSDYSHVWMNAASPNGDRLCRA